MTRSLKASAAGLSSLKAGGLDHSCGRPVSPFYVAFRCVACTLADESEALDFLPVTRVGHELLQSLSTRRKGTLHRIQHFVSFKVDTRESAGPVLAQPVSAYTTGTEPFSASRRGGESPPTYVFSASTVHPRPWLSIRGPNNQDYRIIICL